MNRRGGNTPLDRKKASRKRKSGKVLVSDSNFGIYGLIDGIGLGSGKVLAAEADLCLFRKCGYQNDDSFAETARNCLFPKIVDRFFRDIKIISPR